MRSMIWAFITVAVSIAHGQSSAAPAASLNWAAVGTSWTSTPAGWALVATYGYQVGKAWSYTTVKTPIIKPAVVRTGIATELLNFGGGRFRMWSLADLGVGGTSSATSTGTLAQGISGSFSGRMVFIFRPKNRNNWHIAFDNGFVKTGSSQGYEAILLVGRSF